jgi:hypothetical protein
MKRILTLVWIYISIWSRYCRASAIANAKGQVALFVALVFQVLFVFFAMVVNVGILIHHKINLQNSVDLAAYYGAMKQAEEMNMIAHMNYQMRQSWKLLSFRYRQLGTADYPSNPVRTGDFADDQFEKNNPNAGNPAFCIMYQPFEGTPENQSICKNTSYLRVPQLQSPGNITAWVGLQASLVAYTNQMQQQQANDCRFVGITNWIALANFVASYKIDMANRKGWVYILANNMSRDPGDFVDIEGNSVKAGVNETLKRNMTAANRASLSSLKFYNSLAHESCGIRTQDLPPKWLTDVEITPIYNYLDSKCSGGSEFYAAQLKEGSMPAQLFVDGNAQTINTATQLAGYVNSETQGLLRSSLGFEKNPWCMAYVGVEAETSPDIPFSPFGTVRLKARSFAKPFGGQIGPWYSKTWNRGVENSNPTNVPQSKSDPMVPARTNNGFPPPTNSITDYTTWPNHSRYPGDYIGITSRRTMYNAARAILRGGVASPGIRLSLRFWENIANLTNMQTNGDVLAWDNQANLHPRLRDIEVAAVAPDVFDITNYSIEPDFSRTYLKRFNANAFSRPTGGMWSHMTEFPRGDLGSRIGVAELKEFGIKDQVELVRDSAIFELTDPAGLFYLVLKWMQTLTSWVPGQSGDYSLSQSKFGNCDKYWTDSDYKQPVPGACAGRGGRTGYSVKLISRKILDPNTASSNALPLGGVGAGEGAILNPLPPGW